jgi:hypothetical protein
LTAVDDARSALIWHALKNEGCINKKYFFVQKSCFSRIQKKNVMPVVLNFFPSSQIRRISGCQSASLIACGVTASI